MNILLQPVATVNNRRDSPTDDFLSDTISAISLLPHIPDDAFDGLESFSHLGIAYYFGQVNAGEIVYSDHSNGKKCSPNWFQKISCFRQTLFIVAYLGPTLY